jgi:hypothetical protein
MTVVDLSPRQIIESILADIHEMIDIMNTEFSLRSFEARVKLECFYDKLKDFADKREIFDPSEVKEYHLEFSTLLTYHSELRKLHVVAIWRPMLTKESLLMKQFERLAEQRNLSLEESKERDELKKYVDFLKEAYEKGLAALRN